MTTLPLPARPKTKISIAQAAPIGKHMRLRMGVLLLLCIAVLAVFVTSLVIGSVQIPLADVLRVLMGGEASKSAWTDIVLKFRLPKALTALLSGAALSASGLMMQTFFRNPLADPFVLGVSSGASLGVALVVLGAGAGILTGLGLRGDALLAAAAAGGAGLSLGLVLLLARRVRNQGSLLVMGLMFGYFASAFVSVLMHFAVKERIQVFMTWSFGTFSGVTWGQMPVFAGALVVGLLFAIPLAKPLNLLLLGETYAESMGLNLRWARLGVLGITALLAGTVTAFCGPVGFLGIAAPHLTRMMMRRTDHRNLLPGAMLVGGLLAMTAALLADLPGSNLVLPLNAVTALMGAPVVVMILLRQQSS